MSTQANTDIEITGWDEQAYGEPFGETSLAHAVITNEYAGDIRARGRLDLLLTYLGEHGAGYVGQERIVGTVHGREGSFVLRHTGMFTDGKAHTTWSVVPGSGTGELAGITGDGGYVAGEGRTVPGALLSYTLDS